MHLVTLSLNIFILHRLRNKFQQLTLISLDSASWELHQYSRRMCGPMKNPKIETRSWDSNSGLHDCKADTLPHDHRHHNLNLSKDLSFGEELRRISWGVKGQILAGKKNICSLDQGCRLIEFAFIY